MPGGAALAPAYISGNAAGCDFVGPASAAPPGGVARMGLLMGCAGDGGCRPFWFSVEVLIGPFAVETMGFIFC